MIDFMQDQQATILEARLDKEEYSNDQLVSIKTPLNLPYYTNSENFERTYGSINVNGVEYEYVKRRVYKDTVELLCLPNDAKTNLQSVKNQLYQLSVEGTTSGSNKKSGNTFKISLPDFFQAFNTFSIEKISGKENKYLISNSNYIFADYSSRQERPPQAIQCLI